MLDNIVDVENEYKEEYIIYIVHEPFFLSSWTYLFVIWYNIFFLVFEYKSIKFFL